MIFTENTTVNELETFLSNHQSVYEVSSAMLAHLLFESKLLKDKYVLSVKNGTLLIERCE